MVMVTPARLADSSRPTFAPVSCRITPLPFCNCTPPAPDGTGMCPDPTQPNCQPQACIDAAGNKIYVGDHLQGVTYTPRLAAAMRLALPLFDRVWLDALAEITFAPLGHSDVFPAHGTGDDAALSLPGEPTRAVQLGVGLRVGAP